VGHGEQAIFFARPVAWNTLPVDIRSQPYVTRFKNSLEAFFFRLAFDCY